jgi:hypothetical protein
VCYSVENKSFVAFMGPGSRQRGEVAEMMARHTVILSTDEQYSGFQMYQLKTNLAVVYTSCESSSEVIRVSVLVTYSGECPSEVDWASVLLEVHYASVLVKYLVRVF